jgi:predicted metal-dependent hydrolase
VGLFKILFPNRAVEREKRVAVPDLLADGEIASVRVRRNPRARRISVRVDASDGSIALTVPWHTSVERGIGFARGQREWLKARLADIPQRVEFAPGSRFSYRGQEVGVARAERGPTRLEGGVLHVAGAPEFAARRVRDWLKAQARRTLAEKAHALAARTGRKVAAIRIRDTRTRWGSAASDGTLAFSWRLVLAPPEVLDYVVAHEVAHLTHMNHSADFWALVAVLYPGFERPQRWLAANGAHLLRHG